ncbi:hypothetical protein COY14_04640 [Candidatus Roizmanbacteria bacterium CG_4_10_14_0_2_um_filter_36_9]|uniref:Sortase n=1 Tax=Candidatus Roizmanbacteria bacterium CG_4_10_14_0_2_um_filter_36_9 TaxID=1974823 RepID=A0A2M7U2H9_9BACT|nr:MAG: hypothetical protein COY14_04640 [Candidatus Roizmanbacteria bacterium CG_4_10_14_0_2_um_filter_36_9]
MKNHKDSDYYRTLLLRTIGNFMIFSSFFMIGKTFYEPVKAEFRYLIDSQKDKQYIVASTKEEAVAAGYTFTTGDIGKKGSLGSAIDRNVEVMIPTNSDFGIVVPKIAANAPVIANVDTSDKDQYLKALKNGVAHAAGTAFPGEGGHIYLFAHSTDNIWNVGTYNAVFYLLYKLEIGDEINLFYKGERIIYKVAGKEIINPDEVEYLTRKTDRETLTLQTCWPPGTTLKRQIIFAERVVE